MTANGDTMDEPDDHTLVMIGSLLDNDPWHLEVWVRDDANAKGSTAHWFRAGQPEDAADFQRVSWRWLLDHWGGRMDRLTVLGSADL